jgi:hypothetical protein
MRRISWWNCLDFQADPGSARGRDFHVMSPVEGHDLAQPAQVNAAIPMLNNDRLVAEAEATSQGTVQ